MAPGRSIEFTVRPAFEERPENRESRIRDEIHGREAMGELLSLTNELHTGEMGPSDSYYGYSRLGMTATYGGIFWGKMTNLHKHVLEWENRGCSKMICGTKQRLEIIGCTITTYPNRGDVEARFFSGQKNHCVVCIIGVGRKPDSMW